MKLKRIEQLPSTKLGGSVPGDVSEALTAYGAYYRSVHGTAITPWRLVIQILRTFFDDDRAFQAWRRQHAAVPSDAQPGSANGTRMERENVRG